MQAQPKCEWTKEMLLQGLQDNPWVVIRSIELLYTKQTEDEKAAGLTRHDNGVGFNGVDSPFMSSLAAQITNWRRTDNGKKYKRPLSDKQVSKAAPKLVKYSNQLLALINAGLAA